jgi:hypothetical protein
MAGPTASIAAIASAVAKWAFGKIRFMPVLQVKSVD